MFSHNKRQLSLYSLDYHYRWALSSQKLSSRVLCAILVALCVAVSAKTHSTAVQSTLERSAGSSKFLACFHKIYQLNFQDWKRHKPECLELRKKDKSKPFPTVDAILFAVDERKPRLIKVQIEKIDDEEMDGSSYHSIHTEKWFYHEPSFRRTMCVQRSTYPDGPRLEHQLGIEYDDSSSINQSTLNECIHALLPGIPPFWRGTLIALRNANPYYAGYTEHVTDVVMEEDLAPVISYLTDYTARVTGMRQV